MQMESPGIYSQRKSAQPGPIEGVSTSSLGIGGWTPRGPVGVATLITSWKNFLTKFGSYWANSYIHYAVSGFFSNGGQRAYIFREVPSDAVSASATIEDAGQTAVFVGRVITDPIITLDATHYNIKLTADGETATEFDVTGDSGVAGSYALSAVANNINSAMVSGWGAGYANVVSVVNQGGGYRLKFTSTLATSSSNLTFSAPASNECSLELLGINTSAYPNISGANSVTRWDLTANGQGAWGNQGRLRVYGDDNYRDWTNGGWSKFKASWEEESSDGAADWTAVEPNIGPFSFSSASDPDYFINILNNKSDLVIAALATGGTVGIPAVFNAVTISDEYLALGDNSTKSFSGTLAWGGVVDTVRTSLTITDGTFSAVDQGDGTLSGTGIDSGTINYTTGAWTVVFTSAPGTDVRISATYKKQASATEYSWELTGGANGTGPLTRNDLTVNTLEATQRGIYALDTVDEILNVCLPDLEGTASSALDMIAWADNKKDRFLVTGTSAGLTPTEAKEYRQVTLAANTYNAALYYPWVKIADPLSDGIATMVPPTGHVAGVYARTDANRNVAKTPAGVNDGRLLGIIGLERTLKPKDGYVGPLRNAGVNALVDSIATGRCVYGGLTLSLDGEWKYINVSRLFMFLDKSIYNATQWITFENNNAGLWGRIKTQLNSFLGSLYDDGYFKGETRGDAFLVVCDNTNNSQADIDAGIVNIDVYVAVNKPAELVLFTYQQKTIEAAA
jgi:phage tail sheath protein FI